MPLSPQRAALIATARHWTGTPFRHQGRMPGIGLDCVGLLVCAARHQGLSTYDYPYYTALPEDGLLDAHLMRAGLVPIDSGGALPGDVAVFAFARRRQHAALLSDRGVIHADRRLGKVVEHGLAPHWCACLRAVYRFPGLARLD